MTTVEFEGKEYSCVDISVYGHTTEGDDPILRIEEGEYKGACFVLKNMRMDEKDDSLLIYDVDCIGAGVEDLKEIVDNFIIQRLAHTAAESNKREG